MDFLNGITLIANYIIIPGLTYGSQLALGALGITIIYTVLRFSNFAHGEFMSFGTMTSILLTWLFSNLGIKLGIFPTAILVLPIAIFPPPVPEYKAEDPIATFPSEPVFIKPAFAPRYTLLDPLPILCALPKPKEVLSLPVIATLSAAWDPTIVFLSPVELNLPARAPRNVLFSPLLYAPAKYPLVVL